MPTKTDLLPSVGKYFHLYNRGVNREHIFFQDRNYDYFVGRMAKYFPGSGVTMLAYCLMPNHFHLLVRQDEPYSISSLMKGICDGYAKAINRQLKRSGHLFEGKYRIKHIDDDSYLLHLSRYIHLNPVAARLVRSATEWIHSSCREYCGLRENQLVATDVILSQFGSHGKYLKFLEEFTLRDKEKAQRYLLGG